MYNPPIPPKRNHNNSQQNNNYFNQADDEKDDGSEIYVVDNFYRGGGSSGLGSTDYNPHHHNQRPSSSDRHDYGQPQRFGNSNLELSRPPSSTYHPGTSVISDSKSRKGGVVVETMSAPNPFCPNSRGVCCLLVLINLGLILVTLGFSIVLQLFEPPFVWYCGILFLLVGFIALIASLIFCVKFCNDNNNNTNNNNNGQLYWTHHWQKRISV